MEKIRIVFTVLLLSGLTFNSIAQSGGNPYGEWGKAGIFLKLSDDLTQIKSGKFEIYKLDGSSQTLLGTVGAPADKIEFVKRLKYYIRFLPDFNIPQPKMIDRLWKQFNNNKTLDSLYLWGSMPVVQLSLGAMFLDTTAEKENSYTYLVKYLDANGKATIEKKSNKVQYSGKAIVGKILFENSQMQGAFLTVSYAAEPIYPSTVQTFRRGNVNKPFEKISAVVGMTGNEKKLNIVILDSAVDSGSVYQYYLTPVNKFNLEGENSDTAFVGTYDFSKAFIPGHFKAESVDSLTGIKLSWDSVYYPYVKGIVLERSEIFDSLFTPIAELPLAQTSFMDYNAEPMKKCFYRMKLVGALNEESPYSVRVFGMYEDKTAPLQPFALTGKGLENGVELSWVGVESFIKGFYVYRNNGVDENLELISDLVPPGDSLTVYKDTSSGLQAGYTYAYSVIAENTSHIRSPFSDTVYVFPLLKENLIPPTNLKAYLEPDGVQLYWDDMRLINKTVTGYTIYKRGLSSGGKDVEPAKIDTMLFPENNNYFDKDIDSGKSYEYFVRSYGVNESVSELSSGAVVEPKVILPPAPARVTASATQNGILIKWDKPAENNIDKFYLYRYRRGEQAKKLAEVSYDGKSEYLDASAKKGKLYFYYVVSVSKQNVESRAGSEVGARME